MTRALDLTQRQVRAICEGARKAGHTPIVQVGNILVRLVPDEHAVLPQGEGMIDEPKSTDDFQSLSEWKAWRDRNLARET